MKKRFPLACVAALIALSFSLSAFAVDFKMAIVDLQKALQSVDSGKKARVTLEKEFNDMKKKLEEEEKAIQKMSEDFKKQSLVLNEETRGKKQSELQERLLRYRELFGKSQMEIQTRERELTEPIVKKLRSVVENMGAQRGYTMILEKNENGILFSKAQDDLTEDVIKAFNK